MTANSDIYFTQMYQFVNILSHLLDSLSLHTHTHTIFSHLRWNHGYHAPFFLNTLVWTRLPHNHSHQSSGILLSVKCMHAKSLQDSLWPYELKGFSRQEYWSGLPCPPPGDLPDPGIKPTSLTSPALAGVFFTRSSVWEGLLVQYYYLTCSSYSNFTNFLNNVFSSPRPNQNHIFICHISDNHFLREYFSKKKKEKRKIQIKKSDYLHIHSAYCHYHLFTNSTNLPFSCVKLNSRPLLSTIFACGYNSGRECPGWSSQEHQQCWKPPGAYQAILQSHHQVSNCDDEAQFISVQSLSCVWLFATPRTAALKASPVHQQLLELAQTHVHPVSDTIPTISSSVIPFSSLQSCAASGSFLMSQFFASRWPKYWSFSFNEYSMNIQDWFPLGWTSWISLQSQGLSRVFSNTTVQKHQFFGAQFSL